MWNIYLFLWNTETQLVFRSWFYQILSTIDEVTRSSWNTGNNWGYTQEVPDKYVFYTTINWMTWRFWWRNVVLHIFIRNQFTDAVEVFIFLWPYTMLGTFLNIKGGSLIICLLEKVFFNFLLESIERVCHVISH